MSPCSDLTPFTSTACEVPAEPRQRQGEAGPGALDLDLRPDPGHHREAAREGLRHQIRLPQSCQK